MSDDRAAFEALGHEDYVSLATFRKSGKEVRTAVWIAPDGDRLVVYTNRTSGKAKRIRAGSRARLCACDVRGRLTSPERWLEVQARMVEDPADQQDGLAAVVAKYGWQMRLALLASRVSGRYADRAIIEIRPLEAASDG
ncbi:MAG: PPOX class F420-dependent oxidoreductase [Myxococcota bacterium]|nr:PPOX class F420-dependent oxidoreductase [Myxococcota bacterium]